MPVALDNETIQAVCIDFARISHLNITSTHNIGKTNLTRVIVESLLRKERDFKVYVVDDTMLKLFDYQNRLPEECYLTEQEQFSTLLTQLTEEVCRRKDTFTQNQKTNAI